MIKRIIKLEVLCHDEKGNTTRLNYNNGKYFCTPIINRPHMSNEGILSQFDNTAVDILNQSIDFHSILPENIKSYSLVINGYNEYVSNNTSIIKPVFSKELVTFGENLYAYCDSKSDNVILVDVELDYIIKLISKYLKGYSINRGLNELDSSNISEMKRMILVEKIKKLYEDVINAAIVKTTKSYNLSLK
ncbi:MAG: hypothetical protein ACI33S_02445 [Bacilli bacterium]